MPVKLIGKKVNYAGKTLWEILGNLKNFGVGRLVIKSHFKNYPEVSYYKILKVQPVEQPKQEFYCRRVMVWAEHVFRGAKQPEVVKMHYSTYKPKFQLIPKSEEEIYLKAALTDRKRLVSSKIEWPPLMKLLMTRKEGKDLKPLQTVCATTQNSIVQIVDTDTVLPLMKTNLYNEYSVEELQSRLSQLQTKNASVVEKND